MNTQADSPIAPHPNQLTCIIVTYNSEAHIEECLASIPAEPIEIIVWDNASQDRSVEFARRVNDSRIRIIEHDSNLGFGAAVNAAARQAKSGSELLLVNPDARMLENTAALLVKELAQADVGAVGAGMRSASGSALISSGDEPSAITEIAVRYLPMSIKHGYLMNWILRALHKVRIPIPLAGYLAGRMTDATVTVDWACGFCLLIRRTAWEQVGGFNERFFLYFEDVALGRELRRHNWRTVVVPSAPVVHYEGQSSSASSSSVHHRRGKQLYFDLYHRPWEAKLMRALTR